MIDVLLNILLNASVLIFLNNFWLGSIMKAKLLILLLYVVGLNASQFEFDQEKNQKFAIIDALIFTDEAVFSRRDLSNVKIFHHKENFYTIKNRQIKKVERYNLDKELRGISDSDIIELLTNGGYLILTQSSDDSYNLALSFRLQGGGPAGAAAGVYFGKFITHFVAHSAILVAGAMTGPAAPATITALEATFFTTIEGTSHVVALGCGIIGGILTGPA